MKALERVADIALTTALMAAMLSPDASPIVAGILGATWGIRFGEYLDFPDLK